VQHILGLIHDCSIRSARSSISSYGRIPSLLGPFLLHAYKDFVQLKVGAITAKTDKLHPGIAYSVLPFAFDVVPSTPQRAYRTAATAMCSLGAYFAHA
jgi:hypothetical protein